MIFQNFGFNQNYPVVVGAPVVSGIQRLAVSSSLYAYYDVAFTASYSGSGQTKIFDLSGNNKSGSVVGTMNYNTAGISGSVLRLGASGTANRVEMAPVTLSGGVTFTVAYYINSASYGTTVTELFSGRNPNAYGIFAGIVSQYNMLVQIPHNQEVGIFHNLVLMMHQILLIFVQMV